MTYSLAPCMNKEFIKMWLTPQLPEDPILSKVAFWHLEHGIFLNHHTNSVIPSAFHLLAVARVIGLGASPRDKVNTIMASCVGEMLSPVLPEYMVLKREVGRLMFVECVRTLKDYENLQTISTMNRDMYIALKDGLRPVGWTATDWESNEFEASYRVFFMLVSNLTQHYIVSGHLPIVYILVTKTKNGLASVQSLEKIQQGMLDNLNIRATLDPRVIKIIYDFYCRELSGDNIQAVVQIWQDYLPVSGPRLLLTITQITGGGFSCLNIIGKSMKVFPDFPWYRIRRLFPGEWNRMENALRIVGDNAYYGFKNDFANVRTTLYKSIAFVAKDLLIKGNGESALKQYKGFIRNIPQVKTVVEIIRVYLENRNNAVNNDAELEEDEAGVVNGLLAFVAKQEHMYI